MSIEETSAAKGCAPRDRRSERLEAMLDAAEHLFLENGYEATSLGAVVKRSGGSLSTLYEAFGNKQQLLRAVVERRREEYMGSLRNLDPDSHSAHEILMIIALRLHSFAHQPRTIGMLSVVISQARTDPQFGIEFQEYGKDILINGLTELMRHLDAQGRAVIDDPRMAADLYVAMLFCDMTIATLLGSPPEVTDPDVISKRLRPFFQFYRIETP